MRNLFDQFRQPENQLTHALMCALNEDDRLLRRFIKWATGESAPSGPLNVTEQSIPREEQLHEPVEDQRRGLPDGWIYNSDGWALLIENKIECPLTADQIRRHRITAERRGFPKPHTLALVTALPGSELVHDLNVRRWTELYVWLTYEAKLSAWAKRLHEYMAILEARLVKEEYLKSGPLTVFTGIPFDKEMPYTYPEAKRLLRLAMDELRQRDDLDKAFGIDRESLGRSAITGKEAERIWNFIKLKKSHGAKNFTEFPHLTLSLHRDFMYPIITVPNGIRRSFRKNLVGQGIEPFQQTFHEVLVQFNKLFGRVDGAVPYVELLQRRYPSQRSEPIIDASIRFDLRTAFMASKDGEKQPKFQAQWLNAAYAAMNDSNGNKQLAVGVRISYKDCKDTNTRTILDHVVNSWIACRPLVKVLLGD